MHKKLFTVLFSLLFVFAFSLRAYSAEVKSPDIYKISSDSSVLDYQEGSSPYMQKYRKDLMDKMVDPGKALALSAVYFGLGQLYSGDTTRGAWIMAGGTVLAATILLVVLPRLASRQESVTAAGSGISFIALGVAYLWNIRDAYLTAEQINKDINEKLLLSGNLLREFERINITTANSTVGLNYKVLSF